MNVLLLFTYGISLKLWEKIGILSREVLLYQRLSEKGVNINFLTYGDDEDYKYQEMLDIRVLPVNKLIHSRNFLIKMLKSLFLPIKLKHTFRNIDIIKTNQIEGSWVGILGKIFYRKKFLVRIGVEWLHAHRNTATASSYTKAGFINYLKYFYQYCSLFLKSLIAYRLADRIIVTSDYDIPFIIKHFKLKKKFKNKKIHLIYNFIDEELFKPNNLTKIDKHVLYIGSLHHGKNVVNLVKAFKDLNDFTLDIIGDGPLEPKLRQLKEEFNIKINFLGRFPNVKLPEIINQYQIFILPSISEGNPKTLLEAMSCGVACIGSNIEGINNIIKHKQNGYLCNIDLKSIEAAILEVYHNSDLRKHISMNARQFIINNCSIQKTIEKEYSIYEKLIKK